MPPAPRAGSKAPGGGARRGVLGSMRVRKKMFLLHSLFTAALATILLVTLWPSLSRLVRNAELNKAASVLAMLAANGLDTASSTEEGDIRVWQGEAAIDVLLADPAWNTQRIESLRFDPAKLYELTDTGGGTRAAVWLLDRPDDPLSDSGRLVVIETRIPEARAAMQRLFAMVVVSLLAVYVLVAAALELLVLPGALYTPITRMLRADQAVQDAEQEDELIPEAEIPGDEIGEIMRSRNASVLALRASERRLAQALEEFEVVAAELKRKNHLLETARRNLEGADRLASLGMMSAGIAHELNTPLAVLKGLTDRLAERPGHRATPEESALMQRVVGRLERLGESLLDFARAREPRAELVRLDEVVGEAITLVKLDRKSHAVEVINSVPSPTLVVGDPDRLVQVFVNLVRNAVDAVASLGRSQAGPLMPGPGAETVLGSVRVAVRSSDETGRETGSGGGRSVQPPVESGWLIVSVEDTGPGLDPAVVPRLFEPFFSTRLDARGTGLGLAVAEGIVREHGGMLVGRNRDDRKGAVFEITLPTPRPDQADREAPSKEHER